MRYPTLHECRELLFPLIREEMARSEPAPYYERERSGMNRIESILTLMRRDDYETFFEKSAYMFCSVIDGHPFSNGNKRLAVTLLSFALILNDYHLHVPNMEALRQEFERLFPHVKWETVMAFKYPHEYFFYHLALIIADRSQKGRMSFQKEREAVVELLKYVAVKEGSRILIL